MGFLAQNARGVTTGFEILQHVDASEWKFMSLRLCFTLENILQMVNNFQEKFIISIIIASRLNLVQYHI